jgi:hypothetical protein
MPRFTWRRDPIRHEKLRDDFMTSICSLRSAMQAEIARNPEHCGCAWKPRQPRDSLSAHTDAKWNTLKYQISPLYRVFASFFSRSCFASKNN